MNQNKETKKSFVHKDGVTYFTKQTEQRVLFLLTLAMLIWGVVDYAITHF
ncbi:MAG: hypothetical protein H0S80_00345 [Desulfovibrionaceae bacterium]|nr:hypothetical protein [Desulfovibrionaceae bacterium]